MMRTSCRHLAFPTIIVAAMVCLGGAAASAMAQKVTLKSPVSIVERTRDGTLVKGKLTAYDQEGFDYIAPDAPEDHPGNLAWSQLPAQRLYELRTKLMDRDAAASWLDLGKTLIGLDDGQVLANRVLDHAISLDATVKDQAEAIRGKKENSADPVAAGAADKPEQGNGGAAAPVASAPPGVADVLGQAQKNNWGPLDEERSAKVTASLKAFGEAVQQKDKLGLPLQLVETKFFLFYTNISPREAQKWGALLDKMYDRLCELFGVPNGVNIWYGKAVVFVFDKAEQYRQFEEAVFGIPNNKDDNTAGRCHSSGEGQVVIAFYRQADEMVFAEVLVHESTHGFLHRYRSPVFVPSWANEGLAEWIAIQLVPKARWAPARMREADKLIRQHGSTLGGNFFTAKQIDGWQYGVAASLTNWMIQGNKKFYVDYINAVKDGLSTEDAAQKVYSTNLAGVVKAYGESLRIRNLRP
ncbi:MAG: hypothetical protein WD042_16870 [Phycisphaeraceae bacterium]